MRFVDSQARLHPAEQSLVLSGRENEAEDTDWSGELVHSPWDELRAHACVK